MIYLIGGSGGPNYGDELIVRSWLEYLNSERKGEKVWVESNNINVSNLLNFDVNYSASFVNPLRTIAQHKKGIGFWQQVKRGWDFALASSYIPGQLYQYLRSTMKNCNILHIVGGGFINKNNEVSGFLLGAISGFSKKYNIPAYATGIGLMPLSKPPFNLSNFVKEMISQFSIFEVRDIESYKMMNSLGSFNNIKNGLDDSFMSDIKVSLCNETGNLQSQKPTLHISCGRHALTKINQFINKNIDLLKEHFQRKVFWECYPAGDRSSYDEFNNYFEELEYISVKSLLNGYYPFSPKDYMITSRFHPHMVFSRSGGAGCFFADGEYYKIKHNSVLNLGSSFREIFPKSNAIKNVDFFDNIGSIKSEKLHAEKMMLAKEIYK